MSRNPAWSDLAVAIPTFRRPDGLFALLQSIEAQTVKPGLVLVIDNNAPSDAETRRLIGDFQASSALRIIVAGSGGNLGPAGAFSLAMKELAAGHADIRYMLCSDDDTPMDPSLIERMREIGKAASEIGAAGFGLFGMLADYDPDDYDGYELIGVDHILGGGVPVYDIPVLTAAGVNFRSNLFFGFEELHIALQMRARGFPLVASFVAMDRSYKTERNSPWRSYLYARNLLLIAREFDRWSLPRKVAGRIYATLRGPVTRGSPAEVRASLLGIWDGLFRPIGAAPRALYIPSENKL